jgi:NAD(P)-dependent dehydrogenase (short-subunit alcohol dehydrogenase family)
VRSNAVCPGFVETPMAYELFNKMSTAELSYYSQLPIGTDCSRCRVTSLWQRCKAPEQPRSLRGTWRPVPESEPVGCGVTSESEKQYLYRRCP